MSTASPPVVAAPAEASLAPAEVAGAPRAGIARVLRAPRELGRTLGRAWPFADQMLISATNFVTMVLLARGMSPRGFGSFTLVYSVLLFANSLQSTLITQPHNVLGVGRDGFEYRRFTSTLALGQLVVAVAAGVLALGAGGVALALRWAPAPLLLILGPSIIAWQLQEFVRRVLYTERRFAEAFANDTISYAGQGIAIAVLWRFAALTPERALVALAATSALAAAYGALQLRGSLARAFDFGALRETWNFGKWLAGGEILRWLSSVELYQYLAAAVLGTAATATIKSAQVIFGPTRMLLFALDALLPIRFAHSLRSGAGHMHSELRRTALLTLVPLGVYCGVVALFAAPLLRFLYGPAYVGGARVLMLYALSAFVASVTLIMSSALKARRMTRSVFTTYVYTSIIAASCGWAFLRIFGVAGALVGMTLTSLIAALLFWRAYRRAGVSAPALPQ